MIVVSSGMYGLDLGVMMLILGFFTLTLANEEKRLVPKDMIQQLKSEAVTLVVSASFFLLSAAPFFDEAFLAGSYVRTDLWVVALIAVWIRRFTTRPKSRARTQA